MASKSFERNRKFTLCTGETVFISELKKYSGSHIVGELHYHIEDGLTITSLAVYENSCHIYDIPTELPPLRIEHLIGDARGIRCTCCDAKRKWDISRTGSFLFISRMYRGNPIRVI